jgi:hypothetical protein
MKNTKSIELNVLFVATSLFLLLFSCFTPLCQAGNARGITLKSLKKSYEAELDPLENLIGNGGFEKVIPYTKEELTKITAKKWKVSLERPVGFSPNLHFTGKQLYLIKDASQANSGKHFIRCTMVRIDKSFVMRRGKLYKIQFYARGKGFLTCQAHCYGGAKGGFLGNLNIGKQQLSSKWRKISFFYSLEDAPEKMELMRKGISRLAMVLFFYASNEVDIDDLEASEFLDKALLMEEIEQSEKKLANILEQYELTKKQRKFLSFLLEEVKKIKEKIPVVSEKSDAYVLLNQQTRKLETLVAKTISCVLFSD